MSMVVENVVLPWIEPENTAVAAGNFTSKRLEYQPNGGASRPLTTAACNPLGHSSSTFTPPLLAMTVRPSSSTAHSGAKCQWIAIECEPAQSNSSVIDMCAMPEV